MLECREICKSFGSNQVLRDISIKIKKGEVHALLGQNGAGKSTLVKIITGVYSMDSGAIFMDGKEVKIHSPKDAESEGIAIIHQDQQLVPYFDVTRNAFLGSEKKGAAGKLDFKTMKAMVKEKLELIQADFTADRQISSLSVGQREQVAIISALLQNPRVLILDEPTASLSSREIEKLFEIIERLKREGVTIIYISHHLDEVFRITDSITVLRDSRMQGTFPTSEIGHKDVVGLMIGKELKDFYPKEQVPIGGTVLEIEDLYSGKLVNGVSLNLRKGEILGLAGLVGAGRTETVLAMYGAEKISKGTIKIEGKDFKPKSPLSACRAGIAFIPEDRRNEGIVSGMDIGENLSLATTNLWAKHGIIDRKLEDKRCKEIIDALNVVCTGKKQAVGELSGGNQQKVMIARAMLANARVIIIDEPTRGVDVGTKTEIYKIIRDLAAKGSAVLMISSELPEVIGMSDRVLVMHNGKLSGEISAAEATEEKILLSATGGN